MSLRSHNYYRPELLRALLLALVLVASPSLWAQAGYRPQPKYVTTGKPDQAEGAKILGEFQRAGIAGTYWLGFELRVMPRQGAETTVPGKLLGTRGDAGPLTRLVVNSQQWLIQSGSQASAWVAQDGIPSVVPAAQTLDPLAGTDLTLFDLQMPFFFWKDFVYEGLTRIRGRPAHGFVLYPPADLAASRPGLTGVRVLVDTQFQALVQAEVLGAKGGAEKIISILELKKIGEHWLPKSIDFRNLVSKSKTRLNVIEAALELELPAEVFTPSALNTALPAVPPGAIQRL